ncbi:MAG: hypothetical protein ABMA64_18170 [Myxococcota bacterium]
MEDENQGSMILGVVLGFFLGCLGILIAVFLRGPKTLTGSVIGFILSMMLGTCLTLGFGMMYPLLMSSSY